MDAKQLFSAIQAQFVAEREEALATLQLYVSDPTIVAGHTGIVQEICQWVQKLKEADTNLETLNTYFRLNEPSYQQEEKEEEKG